jgi:eukaryotic-like serine/threonine-protein kinase
LGESVLGQKKYSEAEKLLLNGYEGMKKRNGQIPANGQPRLTEALRRLVQLYQATGQQDEVQKWQKELESRKQKALRTQPRSS